MAGSGFFQDQNLHFYDLDIKATLAKLMLKLRLSLAMFFSEEKNVKTD